MIYNTFYAKLTPNGVVAGIKYSISVVGITAVIDGQKTYDSTPMYFAITPKSSGRATITFKNDTTGEVLGTRQMLVRSLTLANPTYNLTSSATSVNEGGTVTFTLDTTDVPVNSTFAYSVTGINAADLETGTLTGSFKIEQDGFARVTFKLKEDELTEGTETMTLSITSLNLSKSVTINDTSLTRTFDVGWYGTASGTGNKLTTIEEGHAPYIVVKTTNIPDGTVLTYEVTGDGIDIYDFGETPLTGNISITNNRGYFLYRSVIDRLTEGNETAIATVRYKGNIVGTATIIIQDTSKSTTYQIGVYESTTSTTEITSLIPVNGGSLVVKVGEWHEASSGSTFRGWRDGIAGELVSSNVYVNGIKMTPTWGGGATNDLGSLSYDNVVYTVNFTPEISYGTFRLKLTNLNTGAVYYSVTSPGNLSNNGYSLFAAHSPETRAVILNNLLIVGHQVKIEIVWS